MDSVLRATNRALGEESAEMRSVDLEDSSDEEARFETTTTYGEFEFLNAVLGFLNRNGIRFELNDAIFEENGDGKFCGC